MNYEKSWDNMKSYLRDIIAHMEERKVDLMAANNNASFLAEIKFIEGKIEGFKICLDQICVSEKIYGGDKK